MKTLAHKNKFQNFSMSLQLPGDRVIALTHKKTTSKLTKSEQLLYIDLLKEEIFDFIAQLLPSYPTECSEDKTITEEQYHNIRYILQVTIYVKATLYEKLVQRRTFHTKIDYEIFQLIHSDLRSRLCNYNLNGPEAG